MTRRAAPALPVRPAVAGRGGGARDTAAGRRPATAGSRDRRWRAASKWRGVELADSSSGDRAAEGTAGSRADRAMLSAVQRRSARRADVQLRRPSTDSRPGLVTLVGLELVRQAPPGCNGSRWPNGCSTMVLAGLIPALFIQIVTVGDNGGLLPETCTTLVAALRADPTAWRSVGPGDELWVPDPPRARSWTASRGGLAVDGRRAGPRRDRRRRAERAGQAHHLPLHPGQRAYRAQTFVAVVEDDLRAERRPGPARAHRLRPARRARHRPGDPHEEEPAARRQVPGERPREPGRAGPPVEAGVAGGEPGRPRTRRQACSATSTSCCGCCTDAAVPMRLVLLADEFARFPLKNLPMSAVPHCRT